MKVSIENIGVLRQAEFDLGDLTLICGGNNTGKTYATYALYGFLLHWPHILKFDVSDSQVETLLAEGSVRIDIESCVDQANEVIKRGCRSYSKGLPGVFASKSTYFKDSSFRVELQSETYSEVLEKPFKRVIGSKKSEWLSLVKEPEGTTLIVSLLLQADTVDSPPVSVIEDVISGALVEMLFGRALPNPFIASAERTGAAIFRKELNFARNRLLEEMARTDKEIDPRELLFKSYQDYALPVKANADFIRQLETVAKKSSFLAEDHPQILSDFSDIIGGEYIAGSNDTIYFKPSRKSIKLTMDESSSAVRSLLDIGFYLRHVAQRGDLLMVDEPELNLHPENQRRIARLFASLVNLGIKVFITTHSDYIVKELNTLIMLGQGKPHLKRIAEQEGYKAIEILNAEQIRVYVAEKSSIKLRRNKIKSQCQTLVMADVDPDSGIEVRSFDDAINKMNEIQESILWGGDEY